MVGVAQLLQIDLGAMHDVAEDWRWIAWRLRQIGAEIDGSVVRPIRAGDRWSGDDAAKAARAVDGINRDLGAVAEEADAVGRLLGDMAAGGGDGSGSLKRYQHRARALVEKATGHGLMVKDDGTVTWVEARGFGPLSPEEQQQVRIRQAMAASIETELKKVLTAATGIDETMAAALKVIFGTKDNFRSEDRNRHMGGRGFGTSWTETELTLVVAGLRAKGWNDAADLLKHYLDGSGAPVTVDADRMLNDMPEFRKDVSTTLAGVRSGPDGYFQTSWRNSAPRLGDGGNNRNWYYALNDFQYRVVGRRHDGQLDYHVEVKKRYDWGIPSEHRKNLDRYFLHFEQADIARLNMVGEARDYDVTGRTRTRTTR